METQTKRSCDTITLNTETNSKTLSREAILLETLKNTRTDFRFLRLDEKTELLNSFLKYTNHIPDEYFEDICRQAVIEHNPDRTFLPTEICHRWKKLEANISTPIDYHHRENLASMAKSLEIEYQKSNIGKELFISLSSTEKEILIQQKICYEISRAGTTARDIFDRISAAQLREHAIGLIEQDLADLHFNVD